MKKINLSAFTLSEMLVVLCVLGVLGLMLIGSLTKSHPDKNKVLFKKAYSVIEKTVQELINDESLYPYDPDMPGFLNKIKVIIPGSTDNAETTDNKFDELFMDKLNMVGKAPTTAKSTLPSKYKDDCGIPSGKYYQFSTTDGIDWFVDNSKFADRSSVKTIYVDVTGQQDLPNHRDLTDRKSDIFKIMINFDGKVLVDSKETVDGKVVETWESKFLKSHSLKNDK